MSICLLSYVNRIEVEYVQGERRANTMSDMFHEQPTEKAPHIEPTQQASNSYDLADPYMNYDTLSDIPPPLTRERQKHNFIWIVGIGVFVALISLSFIVYALYGHVNSNTGKTSLSTTTKPTAVPITRHQPLLLRIGPPHPPLFQVGVKRPQQALSKD